MEQIQFTPSDFVAVLNQTLDYAYPSAVVVGELANFRVSRNKWVYFDLKDDYASVKFFGTIYSLPGPLEDGMTLQVVGRPHLHEQYGFSVQVSNIQPVGEGTIKKAADLLAAKLEAEGLFDPLKKRTLPFPPQKIGLITSTQSAAYADFIKVIGARYGGLEITVYDVQVQGDQAVIDIVEALKYFSEHTDLADVVVVTRGGGSADDLAAFGHEHLVRAVAASRVPTLVAIGHEIDLSLAELAADARASTPSNAAELLVPDRSELLANLGHKADWLRQGLITQLSAHQTWLSARAERLTDSLHRQLKMQQDAIIVKARLLEVFNPHAALQRGYAIVKTKQGIIKSVKQVKSKDALQVQLSDGTINVSVE